MILRWAYTRWHKTGGQKSYLIVSNILNSWFYASVRSNVLSVIFWEHFWSFLFWGLKQDSIVLTLVVAALCVPITFLSRSLLCCFIWCLSTPQQNNQHCYNLWEVVAHIKLENHANCLCILVPWWLTCWYVCGDGGGDVCAFALMHACIHTCKYLLLNYRTAEQLLLFNILPHFYIIFPLIC